MILIDDFIGTLPENKTREKIVCRFSPFYRNGKLILFKKFKLTQEWYIFTIYDDKQWFCIPYTVERKYIMWKTIKREHINGTQIA